MDASGGLCVNVQHEMFFATSHWKEMGNSWDTNKFGLPQFGENQQIRIYGDQTVFPCAGGRPSQAVNFYKTQTRRTSKPAHALKSTWCSFGSNS